jgi:regulation of enolase protein 1 (concanavalin A-like superfamily)
VLANDTDPDGNPLTAVLVSGTTGLTLNANGSFTYVPPANFNGLASFTYKTNDGVFDSNTVTVNITVNAVNDAPSFTKGANQTSTVSAGAQTVAGWATATSPGPGESGQVVDFIVTNDDNALFTVQPAVSATGTLTYTPGSSTGVATVSVRIHDDGGTANGGVDTSAIQTFTITVTASSLGIFTANQDVGGPSIAGSSSHSAGTYTMSGSGADIWANPDQFQYLHVPMTGDGTITARVVTDTNPHNAAKAGVMMRNTLTGGSVHALMNVMAANGTEFIARSVDGQAPSYANSTGGLVAPYWVRLTRVGNTFKAERSPDGITWTQQGTTQTITMNSTIYVGLVVSSHTNAALHTATFDSVALSQNLFTANQDVGGPSIAGSSSYSAGTYTVSGSGADIWANADQFQFRHVPMTGDGTLTARVATNTNPHSQAKAGVMMRNALTAGSAHAHMGVTPSSGSELLARAVAGQTTTGSFTGGPIAPYWVRLTRVGNTFKAERSPDGITWTQQGTTQTITMSSTIYVGLAVSSHTNAALHTATFDNVTLTSP